MTNIFTSSGPSNALRQDDDLCKESFTETLIKCNKLTHKWVIRGFVSLYQQTIGDRPHRLVSSLFNDSQFEFRLCLFPYGYDVNNEDFVSLFLELRNYPPEFISWDICFQFKAWIITKQGIVKNTKTLEKCDVSDLKWGWFNYISRDVLNFPSNCFHDDGNLTVCCEVSYLSEKNLNPALEQPKHWATLISDFKTLYENRKLSDVVLLVKGREILAHKVVLAARSPVFMAMFNSKCNLEAQISRVEIIDFELEVIEALLRYLYTCDIEVIDGMEDRLLAAAEKYEINALKTICEKLLCKKITIENVSEMIALADVNNASLLKAKALNFFKININETVSKMLANDDSQLVVDAFRELESKRIRLLESNQTPKSD